MPFPKKLLKDPYSYIGWWDLFNRVLDLARSTLPDWTHGIQVAVVGGPKSHIRRLWYLALSAAFGRYRERVSSTINNMQLHATWDITNKVVSIEIVYTSNAWGQAFQQSYGTGTPLNAPSQSPLARLARGPEQLTVGGSWPIDLVGPAVFSVQTLSNPDWIAYSKCFATNQSTPVAYTAIGGRRNVGTGTAFSGALAGSINADVLQEYPWGGFNANAQGLPYFLATNYAWWGAGALAAGGVGWPQVAPDGLNYSVRVWDADGTISLPTLPDDGRVITTVEQNDPYVQPPRPIIDGVSRSGLLSLVAQTLTNPCYLPDSPPCTLTPAASSGEYIWSPGQYPSQLPAQIDISATDLSLPNALPPNVGPDNYQTEPEDPIPGAIYNFAEN